MAMDPKYRLDINAINTQLKASPTGTGTNAVVDSVKPIEAATVKIDPVVLQKAEEETLVRQQEEAAQNQAAKSPISRKVLIIGGIAVIVLIGGIIAYKKFKK